MSVTAPARWRRWLVLAAAVVLACAGGDAGSTPRTPAFAELGTPKALFVAMENDGPARLHAVELDGRFRAVAFRDAAGRAVHVAVDEVRVLSPAWIWLRIVAVEATGDGLPNYPRYVLARASDGRLFDAYEFSGWTPVVKGGLLFSRGPGNVLVRVDLATMSVTRLSDPARDPTAFAIAVDDGGNVRTMVWDDPAYVAKIFPAEGTPPFADPRPGDEQQQFCDVPLASMYGEDRHLYAVCARDLPDPETAPSAWRREYFVREVSFGPGGSRFVDQPPVRAVSCTDTGATLLDCPDVPRLFGGSTFSDRRPRARFLPFSTGFFTQTPLPGAGLSLSWTDLALPSFDVLSGDAGYWQEADSVRRFRFRPGAAAETMVTDSAMGNWGVVGGVLVYLRNLGGPRSATYRVASPGADPELVASSNATVRSPAEL